MAAEKNGRSEYWKETALCRCAYTHMPHHLCHSLHDTTLALLEGVSCTQCTQCGQQGVWGGHACAICALFGYVTGTYEGILRVLSPLIDILRSNPALSLTTI